MARNILRYAGSTQHGLSFQESHYEPKADLLTCELHLLQFPRDFNLNHGTYIAELSSTWSLLRANQQIKMAH